MAPGGTILLVEDEEDIASLVRAYLERDGFRVVWATRGTEGLAALEQHEVRLAILDLQLPDADGFDVCRAIRASSSLPVVMLTAREDEVDRVTGLELGGWVLVATGLYAVAAARWRSSEASAIVSSSAAT